MFKEFMGLPLHPLAVHAAVVLVPLLVLGSTGYALLPSLRPRLGWIMWGLAVASPVATFVAVESGEALQEVLIERPRSVERRAPAASQLEPSQRRRNGRN